MSLIVNKNFTYHNIYLYLFSQIFKKIQYLTNINI